MCDNIKPFHCCWHYRHYLFTFSIFIRLTLFTVLMCFVHNVSAQSGLSTRFERFTIEDGLSQATVRSILQDKKGFLWVATQDGLNRYDGYKFKVYLNDPNDDNSLSDNWITVLHEDHLGNIWIGTSNGGLNKFNPSTEQFRHFRHNKNDDNSLSDDFVRAIYEDDDGFIWVGTEQGLNKLNPSSGNVVRYLHQDNLVNSVSHHSVWSITQDKAGFLWLATQNGLDKFDKKNQIFEHFKVNKYQKNSKENKISSIYQDKRGHFWLGSYGGGIHVFDPINKNFRHYQHDKDDRFSLSHNRIWTIYGDRKGDVWVGTYGGGLNKYNINSDNFTRFRHNSSNVNSLSSDNVMAIFEDRSGIMWIGTQGSGLNKFNLNTRKFNHYRHNDNDVYSIDDRSVWSLVADKNNVLWVGTNSGGLNKFDPVTQRFTHYKHDNGNTNSLSNNTVISLFVGRNGYIWIGTYEGGLNKFDPVTNTFTHYKKDIYQGLTSNIIWSIYQDSDGILWLGTSKGLNRFDPVTEHFKSYRYDSENEQSLSNDFVWRVYQDQFGYLWLGTNGGGVNKFDPETETFTRFMHDQNGGNSISDNRAWSFYEDSYGNIWIGTAGNGLNKLDVVSNKFSHYRQEHGLANNNVYGILEDKQGYLWLSTNAGLSKFDPRNETFKTYSKSDGLQSDEFNMGAYFQSEKGELFFGGVNGFNRFFPENIADHSQQPTVVLTDFLLFNKSVPLTHDTKKTPLTANISDIKTLKLNYLQSIFTFEFSALDFIDPDKNQYRYMLEGFDDNWINTDANRRYATYTNLDAGQYIFRVKASNNYGVWNDSNTAIELIISAPPWQTWWAYLSYFIITLTIIGKYLYNVITEQKRLEELVNDRTQELVKLTTAVEQSPASVVITDLDGNIEYVNSKFSQITGYSQQEVLGKNSLFLSTQDNLSELSVTLWSTLAKGQEWQGEFLNTKKDGSLFWESTLFSPIYDEDNQVSNYLAIKEDITERKKSEQEIVESEARLALTSTSANLGLWDYFLATNDIFVNPTYVSQLHYQHQDICESTQYWAKIKDGKNFFLSIIHPDDLANREKLKQAHIEQLTDEYSAEYRVKCGNGAWKWILDVGKVTERDEKGKALRMMGIQMDISDRKVMEQQLKSAKEIAETATRTKSNFLANMSHEIRTPINAIIGMSYLILQTTLTEKQKNYMKTINTASNSLLGIINDILDFSKIEAGKMDMEYIAFNLREILDELIRLVSLKIEMKNLKLLINIADDVPEVIIGDPLRLRQILLNLTNNAIKFTELGEIKLTINLAMSTEEMVKLKFTISDTGIGMNSEQVSGLFQSFSQGDSSTTRKYGGTGLGLTISKTLVDMMNGEIWVESEPDQGTSFYFTAEFSLSGQGVLAHNKVFDYLDALPVLVVDDDKLNRQIIEPLIENLKFHAKYAENVNHALEQISFAEQKGNPIQIIFINWDMTTFKAIDVLRQLKLNMALGSEVKIVLVSAESEESLSDYITQSQADGYLQKPVTASALLDVTLNVLENQRSSIVNENNNWQYDPLLSFDGAKVLLVDDNIVNQQAAREILELVDINVFCAENGQIAVEMLKEQAFDLVLMDIQMPIMDGYQATKIIRANHKFKQLPIIAMTANALITDREKCLNVGMNEHLTKPITPAIMFKMLARHITPTKRKIANKLTAKPEQLLANNVIDLPGFDIKKALEGLGGNMETYRELLTKVIEVETDTILALEQAIDDKDIDKIKKIAHSLKSVASYIGASQLLAVAIEIEKIILANEKPTKKQLNEFKQTLKNALLIIASALSS